MASDSVSGGYYPSSVPGTRLGSLPTGLPSTLNYPGADLPSPGFGGSARVQVRHASPRSLILAGQTQASPYGRQSPRRIQFSRAEAPGPQSPTGAQRQISAIPPSQPLLSAPATQPQSGKVASKQSIRTTSLSGGTSPSSTQRVLPNVAYSQPISHGSTLPVRPKARSPISRQFSDGLKEADLASARGNSPLMAPGTHYLSSPVASYQPAISRQSSYQPVTAYQPVLHSTSPQIARRDPYTAEIRLAPHYPNPQPLDSPKQSGRFNNSPEQSGRLMSPAQTGLSAGSAGGMALGGSLRAPGGSSPGARLPRSRGASPTSAIPQGSPSAGLHRSIGASPTSLTPQVPQLEFEKLEASQETVDPRSLQVEALENEVKSIAQEVKDVAAAFAEAWPSSQDDKHDRFEQVEKPLCVIDEGKAPTNSNKSTARSILSPKSTARSTASKFDMYLPAVQAPVEEPATLTVDLQYVQQQHPTIQALLMECRSDKIIGKEPAAEALPEEALPTECPESQLPSLDMSQPFLVDQGPLEGSLPKLLEKIEVAPPELTQIQSLSQQGIPTMCSQTVESESASAAQAAQVSIEEPIAPSQFSQQADHPMVRALLEQNDASPQPQKDEPARQELPVLLLPTTPSPMRAPISTEFAQKNEVESQKPSANQTLLADGSVLEDETATLRLDLGVLMKDLGALKQELGSLKDNLVVQEESSASSVQAESGPPAESGPSVPTELQKETIQYLRSSNKFLVLVAIVLLIVMPMVTWLAMHGTRAVGLQEIINDHTNVLHVYGQRLHAEHSQLADDFSAINKRMDSSVSDWESKTAAVTQHVTMESSTRAIAMTGANQSITAVGQRIDTERADLQTTIVKANQLVDGDVADFAKSFAAVEHNLSSQSSNRASATAALTKALNTESSTRAHQIAGATQRVNTEIAQGAHALIEVQNRVGGGTFDNHVKSLTHRMDSLVGRIQEGMCTYCFTCGGKWPVYMGDVEQKVSDIRRHGKDCNTGFLNVIGERKTNLCCGAP